MQEWVWYTLDNPSVWDWNCNSKNIIHMISTSIESITTCSCYPWLLYTRIYMWIFSWFMTAYSLVNHMQQHGYHTVNVWRLVHIILNWASSELLKHTRLLNSTPPYEPSFLYTFLRIGSQVNQVTPELGHSWDQMQIYGDG